MEQLRMDGELQGQTPENGVRALTILHAGDVFLDGPIGRLRRDTKERRREELREAFLAFLSRAAEEKADAVLFSGNLIDGAFAADGTLRFLVSAFSAYPEVQFIIAPGPADALTADSIYHSYRLPANVHVFCEEVLGEYELPTLPLTVYGWGYGSDACRHAPLSGAQAKGGDRLHVLCGYTLLEEGGAQAPVTEAALAAFGAHYAALSGRAHDGFHRAGDSVYAYSGNFEGRTFAGDGVGGYVRIRAEACEGGWRITPERVLLDTYSYLEDTLDVSHLSDAEALVPRIAEHVRRRGYGERTVLRLILRGSVPIEADFRLSEITDSFGLYALRLEDRTVPTDVGEGLLQQMNAAGELYRHFYPLMTDGEEEERVRAARAFRMAYAALHGEEFTAL